MAELGLQIYRFGIEWSRIEPQRGVYSAEAIAHYREEILYLREKGVLPLLTLHHFTNPLWFEDMGAFEHKDSPEIFLSIVKRRWKPSGILSVSTSPLTSRMFTLSTAFSGENGRLRKNQCDLW